MSGEDDDDGSEFCRECGMTLGDCCLPLLCCLCEIAAEPDSEPLAARSPSRTEREQA